MQGRAAGSTWGLWTPGDSHESAFGCPFNLCRSVRGCGRGGEAKLRAMTGLNPIALKHQVRRLVSLGFIRVHVPGVSNGFFVGAKVPSTYYLNLDHTQMRARRPHCAVLVYAEAKQSRYERLTSGLTQPDVARALLALGPAALDVLYHKLAWYTSHLLSLTWEGQAKGTAKFLLLWRA